MFNPYSTLNAFDKKKFSSSWVSTGTLNFIAEIFKKKRQLKIISKKQY
ncbi:MAG: hypothetical protein LBV42_00930 [Methanobrevibacter sp.]|nr:hypothetical protein [Methanobrevibacter sp.]